MNVADALDRNTIFFPDNEALVNRDRRWTYAEFRRDADRFAHALTELGVVKGDRVCLFMGNCAEFAIAFYGILKVGAIAEVHSVFFETVYTDRDDGAEIIYTSGTTGKPKGVVLTHGNVVSNTNATVHLTGMSHEDRLICFLPLYHSFAQNFIFNSSVNVGSTLVILPKFELDQVLETLKRERITRWHAVPTIYIMMLDAPGMEEAFATVRYCFSAASSMPGEVARQWKERLGLPINEGYGLTESTPSATYNHQFRHKEGSIGTPIENVEVQIWSDDDEPLPRGEVGQIVIKGPVSYTH